MAADISKILEVVRRDLDPQTLAIVEELIHDGHRLTVIRDAFMEEKDALAVKMIRDLDPMRNMSLLPFSSTFREVIQPTRSFLIIGRPQRSPFRPRYLILARETAMSVDINDIKVGNRSQFEQTGDVPGEMFAVDVPEGMLEAAPVDPVTHTTPVYTLRINARGVERLPLPIDFETVQPSQDLVVVGTNITDKPLTNFRGAFIGARSEDPWYPTADMVGGVDDHQILADDDD
jgi:hypothetical protein